MAAPKEDRFWIGVRPSECWGRATYLRDGGLPHDGDGGGNDGWVPCSGQSVGRVRATRDDAWLGEVSVIEHDSDGRYATKAKNPSIGDEKAGKGAAIGGFTGLFIGALGGPLGLLLWAGAGTLTGAAIGASRASSFFPMVDAVKRAVPPGASALVLVAETDAIDGLVSALDAQDSQIMRHPLTSDQAKELADAAAG